MTDVSHNPLPPTASSTERVREHRRRKRQGRKLAYLEVQPAEISLCLANGLLQPGDEDNPWALASAVGHLLDAVVAEIRAGRIRI